MVIDTSALIAILTQEAEADTLALAIERDPVRLLSSATLLETAIVLTTRRGDDAGADLDQLLHEAHVEVVPVTADHVRVAREGFARFGKGVVLPRNQATRRSCCPRNVRGLL